MIKRLLTLLLATTLLAACGSSNDDSDNGAGNGNNGGNSGGNSNSTIASPGMAVPKNPIDESVWLGNWNDKSNPNYPGKVYNPLEGAWILTTINGKTVDNFVAYDIAYSPDFSIITKKPAEGKAPEFLKYESFEVNSTQIKDSRGYIYNYTLAADRSSLSFYDGTNTYTFGPYDNNGVWYWKGDWNDPKSLYYPVYNGNYNPLLGTWILHTDNDRNVTKYRQFIFDEKFFINRRDKTSDGLLGDLIYVGKYIINDTGFELASTSLLSYSNNKYWIANDTLYLQGILGSRPVPEISKLVRVK